MINSGKCPNCGKVPPFIDLETPDLGRAFSGKLRGVAYVCGNTKCRTILSVGVDPLALKADTVDAVVKRLKGR